mmetsp:Transcript_21180/g.48083  ORF Transcript_21180/g.48083 Transcript_21180/m.48083 type:complete len:506 (+) Transcript_21180:172-1689(+)
MLFSGLGDIETAQETLGVGVGALAGSTIMVLTLPWARSVYDGRIDIDQLSGELRYKTKHKLRTPLTIRDMLYGSGVEVNHAVKSGGTMLLLTAIPYLLIQIPASYLVREGDEDNKELGIGEHSWSLISLVMSLSGFVGYLLYQFIKSESGNDVRKNLLLEAVTQKAIVDGMLSLSVALGEFVATSDEWINSDISLDFHCHTQSKTKSLAVPNDTKNIAIPSEVYNKLLHILNPIFIKYDREPKDGMLSKREMHHMFRDLHEKISDSQINNLFHQFDIDRDGRISFEEFIYATAFFIKKSYQGKITPVPSDASSSSSEIEASFSYDDGEGELEEMPVDLAEQRPEKQQRALKFRAVGQLLLGTFLILVFSDPMVKVFGEVALRINIPPFYVSFVLAPVISNAPEIFASRYYARKKTRRSMTIAFTALQGSAAMNNTVCLSIFMGLVHFRGIAWNYSAETMSILAVEIILAMMTRKRILNLADACKIASIFPMSLFVIIVLESWGYS